MLDCCVAVKLWLKEPESHAIRDWVARELEKPPSERIYCQVPEFFYAEAANVFWKKATRTKDLPCEKVVPAIRQLNQLSLICANPVRPFIVRSAELALQYGDLAVYDACYLALAEFYDCPLVTDDARLLNLLAGAAHARYLLPLGEFLRTA
ncbi:MAG TPA: type II toxin-antitoxin system VapC family toxin [Armatimonadota bacterium]|nr:type II toxin-antitoxin system VapC family toxin [Armatimonadota bacterium]